MVVTTTFATWFGAETVMGIPAKFVSNGLNTLDGMAAGAGLMTTAAGRKTILSRDCHVDSLFQPYPTALFSQTRPGSSAEGVPV